MSRISIIVGAASMTAALLTASAFAQDPTQTDGDKYKVILENECVRVLDFQDQPGDKTQQHHHPAFVLYSLSAFERALTLPDGKTLRRKFNVGDVMWSEDQTHIGHNVGQTPTHVLIVEMKQAPEEGQTCAG